MRIIDKKNIENVPVGIALITAKLLSRKAKDVAFIDLNEINVPSVQNPKYLKRDYYKSITRF